MAAAEKTLRSGFTTGACAAAAALGAARMLKDRRTIAAVDLDLPAGVTARFALRGQAYSDAAATCFVVKDAGDDPDVTDGVEVHATVERMVAAPRPANSDGKSPVRISGGLGVGIVTKPGLAVPVGEPAINPVPRRMIAEAVRSVWGDVPMAVTISIPDGVERAKKTLNERLGVVGGLSILGTTGIVRPVSHQAWTDTIDVAIDVALAAGLDRVVLVTGRTSEQAAQAAFDLPEEAFVMMGDHVGYAIDACHRKGVPMIVVAAQFAKLLKIACGHRRTHVDHSRIDLARLAQWSRKAGLDASAAEKIECANTAREVMTTLPGADALATLTADRARACLQRWSGGVPVCVVLVGYDGQAVAQFRPDSEKERKT